jgi:hypothetical protein
MAATHGGGKGGRPDLTGRWSLAPRGRQGRASGGAMPRDRRWRARTGEVGAARWGSAQSRAAGSKRFEPFLNLNNSKIQFFLNLTDPKMIFP